jgi:hypothetical protein
MGFLHLDGSRFGGGKVADFESIQDQMAKILQEAIKGAVINQPDVKVIVLSVNIQVANGTQVTLMQGNGTNHEEHRENTM